jgi:hypothetical protein
MLEPIFRAVQEVYTQPGKTIIFGPAAEMGGTIFYAPASYQKIIDRVRSEYGKGPAKLQAAVMLNHGFIAGTINRGADSEADRAGPPSPLGMYQGWGPLLPFPQWQQFVRLRAVLPDALKLLNGADVIGVSCYPRAGADPTPSEIESCAAKFDRELTAVGFNLKAWASQPGKRFIFNEVGGGRAAAGAGAGAGPAGARVMRCGGAVLRACGASVARAWAAHAALEHAAPLLSPDWPRRRHQPLRHDALDDARRGGPLVAPRRRLPLDRQDRPLEQA